jgi:hypothetical protein
VELLQGRRARGSPRCRWKVDIKEDLIEIRYGGGGGEEMESIWLRTEFSSLML